MNIAQLHLILTHFPIVGFIASFALLLYALWRDSREARAIALVGIALSGLIVLPVLATGNAAEDVVEALPGIAERLIERHEDAAGTAGTLAVLAAAAAVLTLLGQRWWPRVGKAGLLAVVGLSVAATAGIGWTSHLGGQIRHPEIALAWNDPALQGERGEGAEGGEGGGLLSRLVPGGTDEASRDRGESGESGGRSGDDDDGSRRGGRGDRDDD